MALATADKFNSFPDKTYFVVGRAFRIYGTVAYPPPVNPSSEIPKYAFVV